MREYKWLKPGTKVWANDWTHGERTLDKVRAFVSIFDWEEPSASNYESVNLTAIGDDRTSGRQGIHPALIEPRGFVSIFWWNIYNFKFK